MSLFPFFLETEEVVHFLDDLCGDLMTQFLSHFLLIFTQRLRDYLAENVLKLFHPVTDRWVRLLDDVLSELDGTRQDFVLNQIRTGQVLITCCEPEKLTGLGQTVQIHEGQVMRDVS